MKTEVHYAATENPSPSICGRFSDNYTRIVGCVTCKDCKKLIVSNLASVAQLVGVHKPDPKLTAGYFNFSPCIGLTDDEMLPPPLYSEFACQTCGSVLAGDRYYCSASTEKLGRPREKLEICTDCFEYFFT